MTIWIIGVGIVGGLSVTGWLIVRAAIAERRQIVRYHRTAGDGSPSYQVVFIGERRIVSSVGRPRAINAQGAAATATAAMPSSQPSRRLRSSAISPDHVANDAAGV